MKKSFIIGGLVVILILVVAFFLVRIPSPPTFDDIENPSEWRTIELKNVKTGETFSIDQYDKPVLLESFAVWCPICKKQQDQIKKLIEEGDDSIHISIDTDPNEDEAKVIEHMNRYGFDWIFSIFPREASASLIEEFGVGVVNAPQAPIILICSGQKGRLLGRGVKSASELKGEIDKC